MLGVLIVLGLVDGLTIGFPVYRPGPHNITANTYKHGFVYE